MLQNVKQNLPKRIQLLIILLVSISLVFVVLVGIFYYVNRSSISIIKLYEQPVSISFVSSPEKTEQSVPSTAKTINNPRIVQTKTVEMVPKSKPLVKKAELPKPIIKPKKSNAIDSKKNVAIKPIDKKQPIQQKKIVQPKNVEKITKKAVPEQKKQAPEIPKKMIEPSIIKQETNVEQKPTTAVDSSLDNKTSEVIPTTIAIHQLKEQAAVLSLIGQIEEALSKVWQGPTSAPQDKHCQIKTIISREGKAEEVEIIQHSSSIAFDIAARNAVASCIFPHQLYGREQIFEF